MLLVAGSGLWVGVGAVESGPGDFATAKAFMASPPVVEEIVFLRGLEPGTAQSLEKFYFGRWQSNGNLVSECRSLTSALTQHWEVEGIRRGAGRYESDFWSLYGTDNVLTRWIREEVDATQGLHAGMLAYNVNSGALWQVLNLGLEHLGGAVIHWSGDQFELVSESGLKRAGVAFPDAAGRLGHIDYAFELQLVKGEEPSQFHWKVDYKYERDLGVSFLPSRIEIRNLNGNGDWVYSALMEIYSVKLAMGKLPRSAFDPEGGSLANFEVDTVLRVDGKHKLIQNQAGEWVRMRKTQSSETSTEQSPARRPAWLIVCLFCIVSVFFVWLCRKGAN